QLQRAAGRVGAGGVRGVAGALDRAAARAERTRARPHRAAGGRRRRHAAPAPAALGRARRGAPRGDAGALMAGYSGTPLPKKLGMLPGTTVFFDGGTLEIPGITRAARLGRDVD